MWSRSKSPTSKPVPAKFKKTLRPPPPLTQHGQEERGEADTKGEGVPVLRKKNPLLFDPTVTVGVRTVRIGPSSPFSKNKQQLERGDKKEEGRYCRLIFSAARGSTTFSLRAVRPFAALSMSGNYSFHAVVASPPRLTARGGGGRDGLGNYLPFCP